MHKGRKLIPFTELREKLGGRSRSACYKDIKFGRLPKPIKIGRNNYWSDDVVDTLIEKQSDHSDV